MCFQWLGKSGIDEIKMFQILKKSQYIANLIGCYFIKDNNKNGRQDKNYSSLYEIFF